MGHAKEAEEDRNLQNENDPDIFKDAIKILIVMILFGLNSVVWQLARNLATD